MGMFDISEETEAEYREKFRQMAQEKVGEPVIAVAPFRRGGAATNFAISKSQIGGLFYAANSLRNKKKAGGLPDKVFLVVTPTKLHAFKYKFRGRNYSLQDEVGVWDRAGLRVSTQPQMGLTMLTLEAPAEGAKATLAPGGVKDDPWSQEVIRVLTEGATEAAPTI
jgi:hypothetical protein